MNDEKLDQGATKEAGEFVFDAEPETVSGQTDNGFFESPPEDPQQVTPPKKGQGAKLLLILLLVIGGAFAGLYLYEPDLSNPDTAVVQAESSKPSKMKIPERSAIPESSEAVKEEVVSTEKVAAVTAVPVPTAVSNPVQETPPAPAPVPAFALTAGSYLYKGELKKVTALLEKQGYQVTARQKPEAHEMTRLLVGLFERPLAEIRLAEVKKHSDGAFLMADSGKFAVYAGSFVSLDKARRAADLLYQKGVRVDERQVKVDLPKTTLRFGEFVTRADAQQAMKELKKLGIDKLQIVSF